MTLEQVADPDRLATRFERFGLGSISVFVLSHEVLVQMFELRGLLLLLLQEFFVTFGSFVVTLVLVLIPIILINAISFFFIFNLILIISSISSISFISIDWRVFK